MPDDLNGFLKALVKVAERVLGIEFSDFFRIDLENCRTLVTENIFRLGQNTDTVSVADRDRSCWRRSLGHLFA
ncbi:hypothetical protein [Nocardia wallacei]|uniref:Uncharacterized protein n=1 Tax=Nocardia wallacei TaxID=480035 RepID=A0A7G1KG11_9NOCA|nr:hypothetical protein [Nocardia wallacei]BCK54242.1 hypothetical protein NWFMUON74_20140 [Nocardia wallacei]